MRKNSLKVILDLFIEFFYLGAIFIIPLYFSIFPRTFNVFELGKMVWLRIFILSFVLIFLIRLLFENDILKKILFSFKKNIKIFCIPFFYLGGLLLVSVLSDFPLSSFWGSYNFQLGLYNYFYFILFFVFLSLTLESEARVKRVIYAIFYSSFLVCFYGIIQILKLDPIVWIDGGVQRIFSTLGQPNFLASYLLMTLPVSIYLIFEFRQRLLKYFSLLVVIMHLVCIYFTYSRAGQLGLILGSMLFGVFFVVVSKKERIFYFWNQKIYRRYFFIFLVFFLSLLIIIWLNQKERIKDSFNFQSGSVASRIDYYQSGLSAFYKKPFLGYGLMNQKEVYAGYYKPDWAIHNSVNSLPLQAHNILLDCLLQGGVFLLIVWSVLNIYFFYLAIKLIKNIKNFNLVLALVFGYLCYLFSLLFGFAVVVTEFYFWVFWAILLSQVLGLKNVQNEIIAEAKGDSRLIFVFKILVALFLLVFLGFRYNQEMKIIIADHYFYQLQSAWRQGEYYESFALLDLINETEVDSRKYSQEIVEMFSLAIDKKENSLWARGVKKLIFPKILESLRDDSYDSVCSRARIYSVMSLDDVKFQLDAEREFEKCIGRGQDIPKNFRDFARYFYGKGDYEKAFYYLRQTELRLPSLDSAGLNLEHKKKIEQELYLINLVYGDIYFEKKDFATAESYYNQALGFNQNKVVKKRIADVFYSKNDLDGAIRIIEEIKTEDDRYYYWPYLIAVLYKEKEDLVMAEKYASEALSLDESNEEAKRLLEEIQEQLTK